MADFRMAFGVQKRDETSWLEEGIKLRNDSWRNIIISIVGDPRVGKSALGCSLALRVDPAFTNERVIYNPELYFDMEPNLPQRCMIVFDEAGVSLDSHEAWQKAVMKALRHNLEVFGYKLINMVVITPDFSFLESTHRKLVQFTIEVLDRGYAVVWRRYSNHFGEVTRIPIGVLKNYPHPDQINPTFLAEYTRNKEAAYKTMVENEKDRMSVAKGKGKMASVFSKHELGYEVVSSGKP